ncbi:hypothetical protein [Catenulispora subtropica]|uniref:Uncharacterized protein n=1 Tax=Catenulispora subtropica TaxID=450798 RepID=A0ABN2QG36_9ACTN
MPKIDWTPGLGRRGRPLRRVLGMGQRQGLIVLSGLAAVMVLLAVVTMLGGFDDDPKDPGPALAGGGTDPNTDASAGGAAGLKGSAKAAELLRESIQHYADLLAAGQKIVGTTRYADIAAYDKAYTDPKSPAAAFAKFRMAPNPQGDSSYLNAAARAAAAYGGRPKALNQWSNDMTAVRGDLGDWVAAAARYQQGSLGQADLDAAAAKVNQDLDTARNDIAALTR